MPRKKIKILIATLIALISMTAYAEEVVINQVGVGIMDVYVPSSLKADADAYVVVNGLFPNTCYSLNRVEVSHTSQFAHQIRTVADVRSGICYRVLVPFNQEVQLGKLKAGNHALIFVADDGTSFEKTIVLK
jgi:hypothetical protein